MAVLARRSQLAGVGILVAGGALHGEFRESGRSRKLHIGAGNLLVTGDAGDLCVTIGEGKAGPCCVVKGGTHKAAFLMARRTILLEETAVGILVAAGASVSGEPDLGRRLYVALLTRECRVFSGQFVSGVSVIDFLGFPCRVVVAAGAHRSETWLLVRAGMATGAGCELQTPECLIDMALFTGDPEVGARKREGSLAVIEGLARLFKANRRGMALGAVLAQTRPVGIRMTRNALGFCGQK